MNEYVKQHCGCLLVRHLLHAATVASASASHSQSERHCYQFSRSHFNPRRKQTAGCVFQLPNAICRVARERGGGGGGGGGGIELK